MILALSRPLISAEEANESVLWELWNSFWVFNYVYRDRGMGFVNADLLR
jgi:hypothetical protein